MRWLRVLARLPAHLAAVLAEEGSQAAEAAVAVAEVGKID